MMARLRSGTSSIIFCAACVSIIVLVYTILALRHEDGAQEMYVKFENMGRTHLASTNLKILVMPDESHLRKLDRDQLLEIFAKYTNSLQMLCNQHLRVGVVTDGGKEVCADDYIVPRNPCIVYSFGSNNEFGFEQQAVHKFGCEVHTFDHTMDRFKDVQVPTGVTLHDKGLAERDQPEKKLYTLDTIMEELHQNEATIDILKLDIEIAEWSALEQMMTTRSLDHVKQLLVEFHFFGEKETARTLGVFRKLYEYGFRTFSRERNTKSGVYLHEKLGYQVAHLIEMSFINMKYI